MRSQEQQITAVERQRQALNARKAGKSYQEIAREVGYKSASGAHAAVRLALKKTLQEPADELRKLEIARLDAMLEAVWPQVEKGDARSVEVALKIEERRARLLGLDAPSEVDVTSGGGHIAILLDR
jgi:AraC-like DNA-binding protein